MAGTVRKASMTTSLYANQLSFGEDNKWATWVGGMLYFEQDIGLDTVHKITKERILTIPRFRSRFDPKKKAFVELGEDEIDLDYHVALKEDVLDIETIRNDYIGDMYKHFDFDPNKPLWQFVYFPKIEDGRAMLVTKIAHAIGDGVSQIEILYRLLDAEDEDAKAAIKDARPPGKRKKAPKSFGPLNRSWIFTKGTLAAFGSIFGGVDKKNPLTRSDIHDTGNMKTAFTEKLPFDKVRDLKAKYAGATINDILVAVLTLTINAYFDELSEKEGKSVIRRGQRIRAGFPISMRKRGADAFRDGSPHNSLAQGILKFQLKYKTRTDLVWKVKRNLDKIKLSPEPIVQVAIGNALLGVLPRKVSTKIFTDFSSTTTALLSNVAGPSVKAKLGGYEVQDLEFLINAPIGCYFGLLSYNQMVSCGICMDLTTSGDPNAVAKHWLPEFNKLYEETMAFEGMVPKPFSKMTKMLDKL